MGMHYNHFYDTELLDVKYILAFSNSRFELRPRPHSYSFQQNKVKSSALFDQYVLHVFQIPILTFYNIGMCCSTVPLSFR